MKVELKEYELKDLHTTLKIAEVYCVDTIKEDITEQLDMLEEKLEILKREKRYAEILNHQWALSYRGLDITGINWDRFIDNKEYRDMILKERKRRAENENNNR